jgi:hypothetical protein
MVKKEVIVTTESHDAQGNRIVKVSLQEFNSKEQAAAFVNAIKSEALQLKLSKLEKELQIQKKCNEIQAQVFDSLLHLSG